MPLHTAKGDGMDAKKSHFIGFNWANALIVFFAVSATLVVVKSIPLLPEAIAGDINPDDAADNTHKTASNEFAVYIALHQNQSWHYAVAATDPIAMANCPE